MKPSEHTNYDDLSLFLSAELVAKVLGISPSSSYEFMHEPGFPVLKVGSRVVAPKKFLQWVGQNMAGTIVCEAARVSYRLASSIQCAVEADHQRQLRQLEETLERQRGQAHLSLPVSRCVPVEDIG